MFKLQRLEITGFKSFADYTEIVFTGNGITAVVGPNGCGKSNVSDCIAWVLGEQRAKSLRGAEMKDVVFQGSKNRKPSGMAEVVLHLVRDEDDFDADEEELSDIDEALTAFDENVVDMDVVEDSSPSDGEEAGVVLTNGYHDAELVVETVQAAQVGSAHIFERAVKTKRHWRPRSVALDFAPGEAVSVTRRLYLSGESEYQLNGRNCRLRDIQDLFAGTGLSGAHYAIVEQGRIGQILSAKPSDRRGLIEEAAGISKFRTRQRAAETRLESSKSNLGRISDIVAEIEKQGNSLRRQAGKTRRFISLQEEYRVRLRQLLSGEGMYYTALIKELEGGLDDAVGVETDLHRRVSEMEDSFRAATEGSRSAEEVLTQIRRLHADNALERDRADREHRYQSESIVALDTRLENLRSEMGAVDERLELAGTEIARLKLDEEKENALADASRSLLAEAESRWSAKIEVVKDIEVRMEASRGSLLQHTAAAERFNELVRQLKFNGERLGERAKGLESEGIRAEQALATHSDEVLKLSAELASEREKLDALNIEKREILSTSADAREKLRQSEAILQQLREEFSRKEHRLETLEELEEKRAVYAPQIQRLFSEQDKIGVVLTGVLADFLNVDEQAETAVECLFGRYLQTVLVETPAAAEKVAKWVRKNGVGRVSTLITNRTKVGKTGKRKGRSTIADHLGASDDLISAIRAVFPREISAELVDDPWRVETDAADIRINFDGDAVIGGSLYIAGNAVSNEKNSSLLAFKRELTGLRKAVDKLSKEIAVAGSKCEKDRKILIEAEERTVDLQSLIIKVERGLLGVELQETSMQQEIERAERHRHVVASELQQIKEEIDEAGAKLAEAGSLVVSVEELRDTAAGGMAIISSELAAARLDTESEQATLNEKRTHAATSGERRRSVQFALRRLENEANELAARRDQYTFETIETEAKIERMRSSMSDIAGRIATAQNDMASEQAHLKTAVEAVEAARENADEASRSLAELNRLAAEAMNVRGSVEIRQAEAATHLKNLNEKCLQEINVSLAEVIERGKPDESFDLDAAKPAVEDLRQRLESFGAINMLAVEELTETEERLDFLTVQRKDIVESIESAEEALREIKERSRTRFKQAFEAINANFVEFFQELFGGGRGEMSLLESDDILEAGIEIVAQPPGKRLQNILLLSGGEKAMTAIAFVLAIFKYRPSPFCLLDEVDAPLDDANVGRFVSKIADMSEKTQFIVITHNKRTMEAARALYGVTMQDAGVSKVVSVKFA